MLRAGVGLGGTLVSFALALFLSAGRIDWLAGWAFLGFFACLGASTFWLADADLIRERAAPGPDAQCADMALAFLGFLGLYPGTLGVAGLDAVRFGWTPELPFGLRLGAWALLVAGYAIAFQALRVNRFFATFVRIQTERGHRVIDAGPYAHVRHPGYAGTLLAHLALPIALGSLWALVPAGWGVLIFVARTHNEDRTLARELPGYAEYQARVRYRLIPGLW